MSTDRKKRAAAHTRKVDRGRKEQHIIANAKITNHHNLILEKVRESAVSVLPIFVIVVLLCFSVSPIETDLFLSFLVGAFFVIIGMGFFSLGAETSMTPIGSKIGTAMTKSRSLPLIITVSFILGFAVTIAEPDLQVLAQTVPHINNTVLLVTVGVGVGFFLCICMARILTGVRLRWLLIGFYAVIFILAAFSKPDFLGIAFDSGGVTTGPMTVPFILALGVGVSKIRSDEKAESDSFGLVALCSIGPILAVLLLGFFYPDGGGVVDISSAAYSSTGEIGRAYLTALPSYMKEMAVALLPIIAMFYIFQLFSLRLSKREVARITIGVVYTYIGLVLFLTGVNVGFSSLGAELGAALKNVIALCAGITDGLGFGDNAKAMLMTRGLTETARLGVALGAKKETFAGLAGVGDLIVTCTSMHSRNRRAGILIGQGKDPQAAMKEVGAVVEGYYAAKSAYELGKAKGIDMPITDAAYKVLYEGADVKDAVQALLSRQRKSESEDAGWQ